MHSPFFSPVLNSIEVVLVKEEQLNVMLQSEVSE